MNKENRKAAKERRAKEREHEAKVASWAGPALIVVVIVGLIIASVLDSKRLSVKSASEDTSTASSAASASSASTSASASLQTDTSLTIEDGDTVNIDYVGSIDGVEFEGGNTKGNGADLVIGSHTYIDDFEEQLIGHHPGDSVDVTVKKTNSMERKLFSKLPSTAFINRTTKNTSPADFPSAPDVFFLLFFC